MKFNWVYTLGRKVVTLNARVLSRAASIYLSHFWLIVGLVSTVWIPCNAYLAYMESNVFPPDDIRQYFNLQMFLQGFFGIIATGSIIHSLEDSSCGRIPRFSSSLGAGLSNWGRLFWTRFLYRLVVITGLLLLVVPGLVLLVRFSLVDYAVIIEGHWGSDALHRSAELTKGHRWRILGVGILAVFCIAVVAALVTLPLLLVESMARRSLIFEMDAMIPSVLFGTAVDCLAAYLAVVLFVIYEDVKALEPGPAA